MSKKASAKLQAVSEDTIDDSISDTESVPEDIQDDDDNLANDDIVEDRDDDEEDEEGEESVYTQARIATRAIHQEPQALTIVEPEMRITSEYMTMYEYAMVVGTRATHISEGSPIYVDTAGLTEARDIAIKEINSKNCPLAITRKMGTKLEIWEVNEMNKPY